MSKQTYKELEKRVKELEEVVKEAKIAEKSLQEGENKFEILFEKAPLGYQSLDNNRK